MNHEKWLTVLRLGAELGVKEANLKKWSSIKHVPYKWRLKIIEVARRRNIALTSDDFYSWYDERDAGRERS